MSDAESSNVFAQTVDERSSDEDSGDKIDHVKEIENDPDYLYRLLRLNQPERFIKAIYEFQTRNNYYPFNTTGMPDIYSSFHDQSKVPTISIFEAAYYSESRYFLPRIIDVCLVQMSPNLFNYLLDHIYLLRIFAVHFPSWFNHLTLTTLPKSTSISLCDCSIQNKPQQNCYCATQQNILIDPQTIPTSIPISLQKFGCHPCDSTGKLPTSILIQQQQSEFQVTIQHFSSESLIDILIYSQQYSLAQEVISTIQSPMAQDQYQAYTTYLNVISKSTAVMYEPKTFAQLLLQLPLNLPN